MADLFKEAQRNYTGLLAATEKRALIWMAQRMPAAVNSDHLTGLGLISMLMVGVSFALSSRFTGALWWVVVWLAFNWFGDSLDGTLARVRGHQRPRYGFYVDHIFDSFGALFVLGGLAVFYAGLAAWAWQELEGGVNPVRRAIGAAGLVFVVVKVGAALGA